MTSWLMWDSTTPWVIPRGARVVAPYRNGAYEWSPLSLDDVKGAAKAFIDVLGDDPAGCAILDVEPGCAAPGQVPRWLDGKVRGSGCIYCNRATLPSVIAAAAGRPFFLGLATLDGTLPSRHELGLPPEVTHAFTQAWGAALTGFNADLSVIWSADWLTRIGGTP